MAGGDFTHVRGYSLAALHALRAAGVELAALGRVGRGRNGALKDDPVHLRIRVRHRYSREQGLGVGMQGVVEDVVGLSELYHIPEVHDPDRVGDVLYNREVVGNEEVGQSVLFLQVLQEVDDLSLNRNVQGRYGLIADDELGL